MQVLAPDSMVGLNMDQIMTRIGERIESQVHLPVTTRPGGN